MQLNTLTISNHPGSNFPEHHRPLALQQLRVEPSVCVPHKHRAEEALLGDAGIGSQPVEERVCRGVGDGCWDVKFVPEAPRDARLIRDSWHDVSTPRGCHLKDGQLRKKAHSVTQNVCLHSNGCTVSLQCPNVGMFPWPAAIHGNRGQFRP